MKTKYLILSVASLFAFSTSCVDMDLEPQGDTVTSAQKDEVVELVPETGASARANAVLASFSTSMLTWPDAERHNDFGYGAVMLFTDANGYDIVSANNGYNWMGNSLAYTDRSYTSYESGIVWNTMYRQILAANGVVGSYGTTPEGDEINYYVAQALAVRAFDYLVLAQLYQFNYVDHKDDPCVPIVTEENYDDAAANGCARSTVAQVYEQIISDLTAAIVCFENTSVTHLDNRYVTVEVAYGLRARAYLAMEEWSKAAADAQEAKGFGNPLSIEAVSEPTFNDLTDFMWGIYVAETDEVVSTGICNWPSHMGSLNWGYCWYSGGLQINKALYEEIPSTDARKGWWLDENSASANLSDEQAYIATQVAGYGPYTQVKYAPYKDVVATDMNANPIPLMRVEEMYLIEAEALAMSGNVSGGVAALNSFVQTYRDPSYNCTATTEEEAQEAVYFQRRIELWGEGMSWFDVMRLNKDVDRRGAGYPNASSVFNISAGSDILLWRIPEGEISANKLISDSDNNPTASLPEVVTDLE